MIAKRSSIWRSAISGIICCVVAVGCYVVCGRSLAQTTPATTDPTLNFIINGIRSNLDNISTAQGKITVVERYGDPVIFKQHSTKPKDGLLEYKWIFAHDGYREERIDAANNNGGQPEVRAFNGVDGYEWSPGRNRGAVHNSSTNPQGWCSEVSGWLDLEYRHYPNTYKSEADDILAANPTLKGKELVGDIECYRIEGSTQTSKHVWWVAPDKGFYVIKHEWSSEYDSEGKICRNKFTLIADRLTCYQDAVWIPSNIILTCLITGPDGKEQLGYEYNFVINELSVNEPIDNSQFTINFPSDTKVIGKSEPDGTNL